MKANCKPKLKDVIMIHDYTSEVTTGGDTCAISTVGFFGTAGLNKQTGYELFMTGIDYLEAIELIEVIEDKFNLSILEEDMQSIIRNDTTNKAVLLTCCKDVDLSAKVFKNPYLTLLKKSLGDVIVPMIILFSYGSLETKPQM